MVVSCQPLTAEFDPVTVYVGFVMHKVTLGQIFIHLLPQLQTPSN